MTQALAKDFGLDFDPLLGIDDNNVALKDTATHRAIRESPLRDVTNVPDSYLQKLKQIKNKGDAIAILEEIAIELIDRVLNPSLVQTFYETSLIHTKEQIEWIQRHLTT